jgi:hypothetical protein
MLQSKLFQVSAKTHALLNNEAMVWQLFKLNLGFWLIIDIQVLPTPRVWLRIPFVGDLIAGLSQYEVCANSFIPDFLRLEAFWDDWAEVRRSTRDLWADIQDPEMLSDNREYCNTTLKSLQEWGLSKEQALTLSDENGNGPYLMIRGISQRIESVRY